MGLSKRFAHPVVAVLVAASGLSLAGIGTAAAVGAAAKGVTATPACSTSGLVVWLDTRADVAAGTAFYHLKFTNQSGKTCTLKGYPKTTAVNLTRHAMGDPASRNTKYAKKTVTLKNGRTATAVLGIADALNFPKSSCKPVMAAGLKVTPPGQTTAKVVPFPFLACSKKGPNAVYLDVTTVR